MELSLLDRLWLKGLGVRFRGWANIHLPTCTLRVALVDGWLLAQCTPKGTILINRSLLGKDDIVLRYVVLHELAHRESISRPIFYIIPFLAVAILAMIGQHALLIPVAVLTAFLTSWVAELCAEAGCAKKMGFKEFIEARESLTREYPAQPLFFRLYHPPDRLVLAFCRLAVTNTHMRIQNCKIIQGRKQV